MTELKALILDMDGTITVPVINFRNIKNEIGVDCDRDLVDTIAELSPERQKAAWEVINRYEAIAESKQKLQPGFEELFDYCRQANIKVGILTRNVQKSVNALCERFDITFDLTVTREFEKMKPHPAPLIHMLETWQVNPKEALMVGDYIHDITCGKDAGTQTCFFHNPGYEDYSEAADHTAKTMHELKEIVKNFKSK